MSLDYIFVKPKTPGTTLIELEQDKSAGQDFFRNLAEMLFEDVTWQGAHAFFADEELAFELDVGDASLHLSCHGPGDIIGLVRRVAARAEEWGVVVIDVQTSKIVIRGGGPEEPDYVKWYRTVIRRGNG